MSVFGQHATYCLPAEDTRFGRQIKDLLKIFPRNHNSPKAPSAVPVISRCPWPRPRITSLGASSHREQHSLANLAEDRAVAAFTPFSLSLALSLLSSPGRHRPSLVIITAAIRAVCVARRQHQSRGLLVCGAVSAKGSPTQRLT